MEFFITHNINLQNNKTRKNQIIVIFHVKKLSSYPNNKYETFIHTHTQAYTHKQKHIQIRGHIIRI